MRTKIDCAGSRCSPWRRGAIAAPRTGAAAKGVPERRAVATTRTDGRGALFCLDQQAPRRHGIPPAAAGPAPGGRGAPSQRRHGRAQLLRPRQPGRIDPSDRAGRQGYPGGAGENMHKRRRPGGRRPPSHVRPMAQELRAQPEHAESGYAAAGFGVTALLGPGSSARRCSASSRPSRPATPVCPLLERCHRRENPTLARRRPVLLQWWPFPPSGPQRLEAEEVQEEEARQAPQVQKTLSRL